MHRYGKLYSAEAGTCVAADTRTCIDDELPDFVGNLLQVLDAKLTKVGRRIDL